MSAAATSEEFLALVEADADIEAVLRQSIRREYKAVLAEVKRRGLGPTGRGSNRHAYEQRILWERPADASLPAARVIALSPSDIAIGRANQSLAQGLGRTGDRRRLSGADPNEMAVALWVEFDGAAALLGADLLKGPQGCGWEAVLTSFSPNSRAGIYKVAHHGAPNAHHSGIWSDLLSAAPFHLIAPYRAGPRPRPDATDIARLSALGRTYSTANPSDSGASTRARRARASLRSLATNIREPWGLVGQVRARSGVETGEWIVETVPPARELSA